MQRRLAVALSISALLIGGATWFRIVHAENSFKTLTVINTAAQTDDSNTTVIDTPIAPSGTASSTGNLTTTDLIGRQFMTDYLNLASNGQATDANVTKLADSYSTSLSNLNSFQLYTSAEIHIVPTSQGSLTAYGSAVSAIYTKYHNLAGKAVTSAGDLGSVGSPNFNSTMIAIGNLYDKAAKDLQSVPTPDSLSDVHLKLINNYLSSANALKAIGGVNSDAVTAYAALSTQAANDADLSDIFLSIQTKLLGSGILFNAGI